MPAPELDQLLEHHRETADLAGVVALLQWDQETAMPLKSLPYMARRIETFSAMVHRRRVASEIGRWLDALEVDGVWGGLDDTEQAIVRETRYEYERARKLPENLVREQARQQSIGLASWQKAREASDFSMFADDLKRLVDLAHRRAEAYGYDETPYDALLEDFERGMTARRLRVIFADLRERLSAMIRCILDAPNPPTRDLLERRYDESKQWELGLRVLRDMGFDFDAGLMAKSAHPFTTELNPLDVRVTTRVHPNDFASCFFAAMHEGGHALYEQGHSEEHRDTILAGGSSLGIHESQSRLWENQIGRSLPFWKRYFPIVREMFPDSVAGADAETFYRAINVSKPSLIRVEADEATYPLHIILRFEIEVDVMEGRVGVDELPDLWNAKMEELLNVEPPDDAQGVLQDVHWAHGMFGYFPTYALGNLYSAQLFQTMRENLEADALMECGDLSPIREWLREKVHKKGRTKLADEIIADVCGEGLNPKPFLQHIAEKFGKIYGVDL